MLTDSSFGFSQLRSLCRVDTTGLAVSLPILPIGLACHRRSSEHVGENEMKLLSGSHRWSLVCGDHIKVRPTKRICSLGVPCSKFIVVHSAERYTSPSIRASTFVKKLTAKWSWYSRGYWDSARLPGESC